jgi:hypothetical protein
MSSLNASQLSQLLSSPNINARDIDIPSLDFASCLHILHHNHSWACFWACRKEGKEFTLNGPQPNHPPPGLHTPMKEVGEKFKRLFDPNGQSVWLSTRLTVLENLIEEEFINSLKDFQSKLVRRASETAGISSIYLEVLGG